MLTQTLKREWTGWAMPNALEHQRKYLLQKELFGGNLMAD